MTPIIFNGIIALKSKIGNLLKVLKGYQYRIYPNEVQKVQFAQHFGSVRWVYNWALGRRKQYYKETKKQLSRQELQNELVAMKKIEDKKWLTEVNSQSLLAVLINLESAFKNFFNKKAGFPSFKKKYFGNQSYQCPQHVKVDFENQTVDVPKIKNISIKLHRRFEGNIKTCTIKKTATNKYFISILVDTPITAPLLTTIEANRTVGIDLGIKSFFVTSEDDTKINPKFLRRNITKLKRQQRRLSRKVKNSKNRVKAKHALAKIHEKIANQRLDLIHQASAELVYKSHDTSFALESLNIKGMMKNHKLALSIGECGWALFVDTLKYKAIWNGKNVIFIDPFVASSKLCSNCGSYKENLTLADRQYHCEDCSMICDRDLNAARNIKKFALRQIGLEWPESTPVDHALTGVAVKQPSNSWVEAGSRHYSVT